MFYPNQHEIADVIQRERVARGLGAQRAHVVRPQRGVRLIVGRRPREGERIVIAIARPPS